MKNKKILVLGHGRHGKDTVSEFINKYCGLKFKSSSLAASEIFLYDDLKIKYGYKSPEECYEDRHTEMDGYNMRDIWHNKICEYNKDDPSRLAKDILVNHDIYVGMRSNIECQSCVDQGLFDIIVGVYDYRKPLENETSFNIDINEMCDFIIMNNSDLESLEEKVKLFCKLIGYRLFIKIKNSIFAV